VTIVTTLAMTIAANDGNSANRCRTNDAMPSTVAIAPGPNISGIASGTNATVSPAPVGAFRMMEAVSLVGMNSAKPIRIRMIPPTIRTMLSGTSKIFSSNAPKIRKKNNRSVA
jgi:hypothetical protein